MSHPNPDALILCAHSNQLGRKSDMVEIAGQCYLPEHKDYIVAALREGATATRPISAGRLPKRPKSVLWAGVFCTVASVIYAMMIYQLREKWTADWNNISFFILEGLCVLGATLIWWHPRRKLTYYLGTAPLVWTGSNAITGIGKIIITAVSRGQDLGHGGGMFLDSKSGILLDWIVIVSANSALIYLAWRFIFGSPSRTYFGMKKATDSGARF